MRLFHCNGGSLGTLGIRLWVEIPTLYRGLLMRVIVCLKRNEYRIKVTYKGFKPRDWAQLAQTVWAMKNQQSLGLLRERREKAVLYAYCLKLRLRKYVEKKSG